MKTQVHLLQAVVTKRKSSSVSVGNVCHQSFFLALKEKRCNTGIITNPAKLMFQGLKTTCKAFHLLQLYGLTETASNLTSKDNR